MCHRRHTVGYNSSMIPAWLIEELKKLQEKKEKEAQEELVIEPPMEEPPKEEENPGYITW